MDESRKRAKTGNDGVAGAPATSATAQSCTPSAKVDDAAATATAATKIAELQAKLDACEKEKSLLKSALQWAYTIEKIPRQHWLDKGYSEESADEMEKFLDNLMQIIQALRMGTVNNRVDADLDVLDIWGERIRGRGDYDELLLPYWEEFSVALKYWSDFYPDEKCLEVWIRGIELPRAVLNILRPAFEQSRIKELFFSGSRHPGDVAYFIKKVLQTNHSIIDINFYDIMFAQEDVETICGAIESRNTGGQFIKHVNLTACFVDGIENQTLRMILASVNTAGAQGVSLCLDGNGMSSREAAVIAEFLSSNSNFKELDLSDNLFEDADAVLLANALSSNTNLRVLVLDNMEINGNGRLAFLRETFDVSSLVSCAAMNHTCRVDGLEEHISDLNSYKSASRNKWEKIFAMLALSSGDVFMNTTLLRGVPAKLIPVLLDWASDHVKDGEDSPQLTDLYLELSNTARRNKHDVWDNLGNTRTLNCVYELMRGWVVSLIFA